MKTERVMLVSSRSLLGAGIMHLLERVADLQVEMATVDDPELAQKIRRFVPNTIVLHAACDSPESEIITRFLKDYPRVRVVSLDLHRTDMEVYRMDRHEGTSFDRLLKVIRNEG